MGLNTRLELREMDYDQASYKWSAVEILFDMECQAARIFRVRFKDQRETFIWVRKEDGPGFIVAHTQIEDCRVKSNMLTTMLPCSKEFT